MTTNTMTRDFYVIDVHFMSYGYMSNSITQNKDLSQIQNNFSTFLSFQCHIYRALHSDYNIINRLFSILPLEKRLKQLNLKFLYKLLHNIIDCPELIKRLYFKKKLYTLT